MSFNQLGHAGEEWSEGAAARRSAYCKSCSCGRGSCGSGLARPVAGHKHRLVGVYIFRIPVGNIENLPVIIIRRIVGRDGESQHAAFETGEAVPERVDVTEKIGTAWGKYLPSAAGGYFGLYKSVRTANREGGSRVLPQRGAVLRRKLGQSDQEQQYGQQKVPQGLF